MRIKHAYLFSLTAFFGLLLCNCVEPFTAETLTFENVLVVDALLTDEDKQHRILLTRAFCFEEENPNAERNADVRIIDIDGREYDFKETEPGVYLSEISFQATQGSSYRLEIKTSDGKWYVSESVVTPMNIAIKNLTAERQINDIGEEGVAILVDNSSKASEASEASYFRYEYEETYKIITPKYDPFEFEVIENIACDGNFYEVGIKPRAEEQRICFGSAVSKRLIQASTTDLENSTIEDLLIQFIGRDNYIMSYRYSILVKQFSQTQDAHSFYDQLGNFSSSDNIFLQIQLGFLIGNFQTKSDQEEKVLGYFEVATVDEERVYYNYSDVFPNEELPPYAINCETLGNSELITRGYHCDGMGNCDGSCESPLIEGISAGLLVFVAPNENPTRDMPGP